MRPILDSGVSWIGQSTHCGAKVKPGKASFALDRSSVEKLLITWVLALGIQGDGPLHSGHK